jgi:hypothetical protein
VDMPRMPRMPAPERPRYRRLTAVAEWLGTPERTLRLWCQTGLVAHARIGKAIYIDLDDLDRFLESGRIPPDSQQKEGE